MLVDERFFEHAAQLEQQERDRGIKAAQLAAMPEHSRKLANGKLMFPDFDHLHCYDCDEEIPHERLALGKVRCVTCQTLLERRAKGL